MKRIFIIFALLIVTESLAVGQTENRSVAQNSNVEQEIIRLERERLEAYARAAREAFDRIVADDFTMTHSDGSIFDKAQERGVLRPSTAARPLPTLTTEDIRVRVYGDAAVITGRLVEQGERVGRVSLRFTNTYIRRQGRWQIVAGQLTRLPQERTATTVTVNPNLLDAYVGQYELCPSPDDHYFERRQSVVKRSQRAQKRIDTRIGNSILNSGGKYKSYVCQERRRSSDAHDS